LEVGSAVDIFNFIRMIGFHNKLGLEECCSVRFVGTIAIGAKRRLNNHHCRRQEQAFVHDIHAVERERKAGS